MKDIYEMTEVPSGVVFSVPFHPSFNGRVKRDHGGVFDTAYGGWRVQVSHRDAVLGLCKEFWGDLDGPRMDLFIDACAMPSDTWGGKTAYLGFFPLVTRWKENVVTPAPRVKLVAGGFSPMSHSGAVGTPLKGTFLSYAGMPAAKALSLQRHGVSLSPSGDSSGVRIRDDQEAKEAAVMALSSLDLLNDYYRDRPAALADLLSKTKAELDATKQPIMRRATNQNPHTETIAKDPFAKILGEDS